MSRPSAPQRTLDARTLVAVPFDSRGRRTPAWYEWIAVAAMALALVGGGVYLGYSVIEWLGRII